MKLGMADRSWRSSQQVELPSSHSHTHKSHRDYMKTWLTGFQVLVQKIVSINLLFSVATFIESTVIQYGTEQMGP